MRLRYIVLFLFLVGNLFAQKQRFIVTPNQEVIPLTKDQDARQVMLVKQMNQAKQTAACTNQATFGFPINEFPTGFNFGGYHKDVLGQWFQAKAAGTIDTLFWQGFGLVSALDSLVSIRIHKSNLGPTYGPGVRPGPFNPPCQNWGYWNNTNDPDQQVAAFIEEATDPTWISTINRSASPSGPPFQEELWGFGGFPKTMRGLGAINSVAMNDLVPCSLKIGDLFFVSMKVNGPIGHPTYTEARTEWSMYGTRVDDVSDENYPARDWKFYEHDKGPSNCASGTPIPIDSIRRGWVARGGLTAGGDSLDIGMYNWWYVMTVYTNVPPVISSVSTVTNTFDTGEQAVEIHAEDCNPADPTLAGIESLEITWTLNGVDQTPVTCENSGGDLWEGAIPGCPAPSTVTWSVTATDSQGLARTIPQGGYRIVALANEYFAVDTSGTNCTNNDIRSTGYAVDPSAFFKYWRQDTVGNTGNKWDDGTAGPYSLGGAFTMFGKNYNYAWVGVNGAIALTETATDSTSVNSVGSYTAGWDFPGTTRQDGKDTTSGGTGRKPQVFIAPMWSDWYLRDTGVAGSQFGRILMDTIGCRTIVEWDSLGVFNATGDPFVDEARFRVVLNRCDGTIEFQYDNIGTAGQDTNTMAGIAMDTVESIGATAAPFVYINRYGGPVQTNPTNGRCFKIYQAGTTSVKDKWNMVSISRTPIGSTAKTVLFPTAASSAFKYSAGYATATNLTVGEGYWLKFNGDQVVGYAGTTVTSYTKAIPTDWNMLGSISVPVATSSIVDAPVNGQIWYSYSNGYSAVSSLKPGFGYWVKALSAGNVTVAATGAAPKSEPITTTLKDLNKITINDFAGGEQVLYVGNSSALNMSLAKFDMPPVPPEGGFDARFKSNRFVETYNDDSKNSDYVININSSAYPVVVRWDIVKDKAHTLIISDNADGKSLGRTILNNSGFVRISNPAVKSLKLRVVEGMALPTEFAIGQNYPNPFNPITHFQIALPTSSELNVTVFDVLGREVATLINGQQDAGYHTIEWDGKDSRGITSPSGMYFVRMNAGDFSSVRKIMLLK